MREKDPFFVVPRTPQDTSEGPVDLPILYYDTTSITAPFLVDRDAAEAEVAPHGLQLGITAGGRAMAFVAGYDYRVTTVGPYYEVGLAIPVVPAGSSATMRWHEMFRDEEAPGRRLGYYVVHLPVTTDAADAAGRDIWGFPKFVTAIEVSASGRDVRIRVDDPDGAEPIMTTAGRAGPIGTPAPPLSLMLYTRLAGQMLRSTANVRGTNTLRAPGSIRMRVGGSDHPMADVMRRLGLDGARPLGILATHRFQSRLNAGVPVGKAGEPVALAAEL